MSHQFEGMIDQIKSMKDGGWKITIMTNELSNLDLGEVAEIKSQGFGKFTFEQKQ